MPDLWVLLISDSFAEHNKFDVYKYLNHHSNKGSEKSSDAKMMMDMFLTHWLANKGSVEGHFL